jgi:hypothetical protein
VDLDVEVCCGERRFGAELVVSIAHPANTTRVRIVPAALLADLMLKKLNMITSG